MWWSAGAASVSLAFCAACAAVPPAPAPAPAVPPAPAVTSARQAPAPQAAAAAEDAQMAAGGATGDVTGGDSGDSGDSGDEPATDGDVSLEYEVAPGLEQECFDEERFRFIASFQRIEMFTPKGKPGRHHLKVAFRRGPGRRPYQATFTLSSAGGASVKTTELDGERCDDTALHVIATAMFSFSARPPASPPPSAPPAPPPAAPPPPAPRRLSTRELLASVCEQLKDVYGPCMDLNAAVLAGGLFSAGWPGDVGGGFYVGGELRFGEYRQERWSLGFEMRALMPAKATEFSGGARLEASSVTGALVPCVRWKVMAGCLLVEGGAVVFGGPGYQSYGDPLTPVVDLGPRLALDLPITGRLAFRAFADLRFVLVRPVFNFFPDPGGELEGKWKAPIASGLFGVGLSY